MLDLRERKPAALDASDIGTFLHYLLEHFLRGCLAADNTFVLPPKESILPTTEKIVNDYLRELLAVSMTDATTQARTLHQFRRLRELAAVLLQDILGEFSHSRFLPAAFELRVGGKNPKNLPPYEIKLDDDTCIHLGGKIDRVDIYKKDERIYLRVVDYKSGSKEFAVENLRRGLDVQLFVYLFALCRDDHIPAGAVYLSVKEEQGAPHPVRSGLLLDEPDVLDAMNCELNPHYLAGKNKNGLVGLTSGEQLSALEQQLCSTLRAIGSDMLRGRAARTPSEDACRFCPLKGHCPDTVFPSR
jgi:ATP-dependent helicase/nuclease subunit B